MDTQPVYDLGLPYVDVAQILQLLEYLIFGKQVALGVLFVYLDVEPLSLECPRLHPPGTTLECPVKTAVV